MANNIEIETSKKRLGKEKVIGIVIFVVLIFVIILFALFKDKITTKDVTTVYGAVGGGKENLLADEEFNEILEDSYGIKVVNESWSNGKLVKNELLTADGGNYDFVFFSDQRFYDYYKLEPDSSKGEAKRTRVQKGNLTLNTPIVIYSWDIVVDTLIKEEIVTLKDGVYYITDMNKLLDYITQRKSWSDIGLDSLYGKINIDSTDPVTSSPGATYYGLLLSIMSGGEVTEENIETNLPKLKEFYEKSGYMNNTPADLFDMYLKTGVGSKPMIVDYEKSIIDFANSNPEGYAQVKDKIRILYPTPTIWNSHCIATFTDNGNKYYDAFENARIQQLAWSKYGFRTGTTGGNYDVSAVGVSGIPQTITSTVPGLKMALYDRLIEYLSSK